MLRGACRLTNPTLVMVNRLRITHTHIGDHTHLPAFVLLYDSILPRINSLSPRCYVAGGGSQTLFYSALQRLVMLNRLRMAQREGEILSARLVLFMCSSFLDVVDVLTMLNSGS